MKKSAEEDRLEFEAAIATMPEDERAIARALAAAAAEVSPQLTPRLFYAMPAFALDGKTICFFQSASKFKTRYCTLGFTDNANLDDGTFWPTAFAVTKLTPELERQLRALLRRATSN